MLSPRLTCRTLLAVTITLSILASSVQAESLWPQWRGPHRDAKLESAAWPDKLGEAELRLHWRVPLGPSYSGPIVANDRVFVTETKDKQKEVVYALRRDTGAQIWKSDWEGAMRVPFFARENGDWIRATPAYDGELLFVAGMRDVLVALDAQSGEVRWKRDFVKELNTPLPSFGHVSSPLVDGEDLYVQAGASVMKLNKNTGEAQWRSLAERGGMMDSAFSSPILGQLAGQSQLVVQTRDKLAGLDPDDGTVLWEVPVPAFRGMNILTPTIYGDSVFTASYQGGTFLFQLRPAADQWEASEAWSDTAQGYMSSPIIIGDHVYLHLRNQRFACFNLKTGERMWTTRPFGKYWSMVANGDRILALDERGELLLIDASPDEFRLVDRREVSDSSTWAHLAVAGEDVYVRALDEIIAFKWTKP